MMKPTKFTLTSICASFLMIGAGSLDLTHADPAAESPVKTAIDWPAFMGRHDLIWDAMPTEFDYGAFLGNGMLGSVIHQDGPKRLRWEMGRSDVTAHRRDNARMPIGGLVLTTVGKIQNGTMRMDLWNAEIRGSVTTDKHRRRRCSR